MFNRSQIMKAAWAIYRHMTRTTRPSTVTGRRKWFAKAFTSHRDVQLSMFCGPQQEEIRNKVATNYDANMEAKLVEFRRLEAEYDRRERDIGLTEALAEARRLSDEVRGIEAEVVAFVPATLAEAVHKAAWCAQAYRSDDTYLSDHSDGIEDNPLLIALEAIGRALA